ncbi:hypothetical protein H9W91_07265 [Streptomyces alfalfae]|uniref:hypothetical protein n=1 Tax=Streptomyces alfalfae TaxID=1642299 RepID=UPI001BAC5083|nr:hypothetical protein [Streptomyces alfalfae]QUI30678.1 hypothetical protein H9W91_07265 [Streptomyces alfalfae]
MPLATTDDVAARLGRPIADDEKPKVEAFIEDASAFVADYCTGTWDVASPPAVFKAVVCAEVIRWLSVSPGVVSEKVGDLQVDFESSAVAQNLSPAAQMALRRYRRQFGTVTFSRM